MVDHIPIHFASARLLLVVGPLVIFSAVMMWRRARIPQRWGLVLMLGMMLIGLAAAEPMCSRPTNGLVTVMVDLSASTRGAIWRDRAALDQEIVRVLGDTPYRLIGFGESNGEIASSETLADMPGDRTVFSPPPSNAILLFSDGQFAMPTTAPPTYAVIDPGLDHPPDAAVSDLEVRKDRVIASIRNNGSPRTIQWSGATADNGDSIAGSIVETAKISGENEITVALSPGDLWPENDSLSIRRRPPVQLERWWIGNRNPGAGWKWMKPWQLQSDAADYLSTGVIVLDNVSPSSVDPMSNEQWELLGQFVRDLGGGIVLLGGDQAFAAGSYGGTTLDTISPLASYPPTPTTQWIVLIDGSGSMASASGFLDSTRWQVECSVAKQLLRQLPTNDLVSIGSFAERLRWWSQGKNGRATAALPLPPADAQPNGPTNLQAALEQIIFSAGNSAPTQVLLMTDADAELTDVDALARKMVGGKVHFNLLAIGNGSALPALRTLAATTGGAVIEQSHAESWSQAARQLLEDAEPPRVSHQPVDVRFSGDLAALSEDGVKLWNRTWLKDGATQIASAGPTPMAAVWQVGEGKVAAVAYSTDVERARKLADVVAAPPRDPRFSIDWKIDSNLRVTVKAMDRGTYMNDVPTRLELSGPTSSVHEIPQTAPGEYEVELQAPRSAVIATVRTGDRVLERFAIAGRYAPEFDAIGNDRANLTALAERTGGVVIEPGEMIDFHWSKRETALGSWLAMLGAVLIGTALFFWKNIRVAVAPKGHLL